jgi:hypothetical protein
MTGFDGLEYQNHDIMAEVAGVGVPRDKAGEAGIATPLWLSLDYPHLDTTTMTIDHPQTCSI